MNTYRWCPVSVDDPDGTSAEQVDGVRDQSDSTDPALPGSVFYSKPEEEEPNSEGSYSEQNPHTPLNPGANCLGSLGRSCGLPAFCFCLVLQGLPQETHPKDSGYEKDGT